MNPFKQPQTAALLRAALLAKLQPPPAPGARADDPAPSPYKALPGVSALKGLK